MGRNMADFGSVARYRPRTRYLMHVCRGYFFKSDGYHTNRLSGKTAYPMHTGFCATKKYLGHGCIITSHTWRRL